MGGDGGSIPARNDLVRNKKKAVKEDPNTLSESQWTQCAISQEPLKDPVVASQLGQLFNKDALIQLHLLAPNKLNMFKYIKGLKDVIPCRLTWANEDKNTSRREFVCPVTGVPGNGKHRFVVMRGCGCVLSHRALTEVPSKSCLVCSKPLDATEVGDNNHYLLLFPESDQEREALELVMNQRKARAKTSSKSVAQPSATAVTSQMAGAESELKQETSRTDDETLPTGRKRKAHELQNVIDVTLTKAQKTGSDSDASASVHASHAPPLNEQKRDKSSTHKVKPPSKSAQASQSQSQARASGGGSAVKSVRENVEQVVSSRMQQSKAYSSIFISKEKEKELRKQHLTASGVTCTKSESLNGLL